jgi:hypothetical protein
LASIAVTDAQSRAFKCLMILLAASFPLQLFGCRMQTVDLAADKFTEEMGARMTEFTINPAKGTAEMRQVCFTVHT